MTIRSGDPIPDGHFDGGSNITGSGEESLAGILDEMKEDLFLYSTVEDMAIYVSDDTGSDGSGKGTQDKPYKTLTKAMSMVPERIEHTVRVLVEKGTYTEFPLEVGKTFFSDGCLVIEGTGTPASSSGPYTVNTATRDATLTNVEINVSGASWTNNEFFGKWVYITSGVGIGQHYPVFTNSSDTIVLPYITSAVTLPSNGDTFEIVEPAVTISVDHSLMFRSSNFPTAESRVSLANLKFTTSLDERQPIKFIGGGYLLNFVSLHTSVIKTGAYNFYQVPKPLVAQETSINHNDLVKSNVHEDSIYEAKKYAYFQPYNGATMRGPGEEPPDLMIIENATVRQMPVVGGIDVRKGGALWYSCAARLTFYGDFLYNTYINNNGLLIPISSFKYAIWIVDRTLAFLSNIHIEDTASNNAVLLAGASGIEATKLTGNQSNISGYAVEVMPMATLQRWTNSTISGTTGDYYFNATSTGGTWASLPANDGNGAFIVDRS